MKKYLDPIFNAATTDEICAELQRGLDSVKAFKDLAKLPDNYEGITAGSPSEIQDWCDKMRDDDQAKEEGKLNEVYSLFQAALGKLRELGFHRAK